MNRFGATRTPRNIVFGKGQRRSLGLVAKSLGSRAFVCTDERLSNESVFKAMVDDLKANGVFVHVYDRTIAELPLTCLDECISSARTFGPDVVIGIGGGSCMDLAKVAAIMLAHGGDIRSYYGEFKVPGPVLPADLDSHDIGNRLRSYPRRGPRRSRTRHEGRHRQPLHHFPYGDLRSRIDLHMPARIDRNFRL